MLKFLFLSILIIYLIARFSAHVFRLIYWLSGRQNPHKNRQNRTSPSKQTTYANGMKITVAQNRKKGKDFQGGEYVDYEEIEENQNGKK